MKFGAACLSFVMVACAGPGEAAAERARQPDRVEPALRAPTVGPVSERASRWSPRELLLASLADCATAEELRDRLQAGLQGDERRRVGFDEVTIDVCIERLTAAVLQARQQPVDAGGLAAQDEAADLYLRARREALVRRTAGAASCLPMR